VGKATADRLQHFGCRADVLPTDDLGYSAAALLETLGAKVTGQHWLVTNTNRSRDVLERGLTAAGATVTPVRVYETRPVQTLRPSVTEALKRNQINFCTITSSAVAEAAYDMLGEFRSEISPISLSESASTRLSQLQWPAVVTASHHTAEALVEAILDAYGKGITT
jgi:uroporphyrinogen-III synthase